MRLNRNTWIASSILLPILLAGCAEEEQAAPAQPRLVLAMKIGDPSTFDDRWVPGRAKATRELDLSFRVDGRMISRPATVGDRLEEGDLVAKLDPTDYEVDLQNTVGNLDESRAGLVAAQSELDRQLRIQKQDPGAISQASIDRAREARDRSRANIKALEAAVADAQNRLERATLRAPFASTVVAKYAEAFEDVQANQNIVRLVDTSRIEFEVNLPERDISIVEDITNIRVQIDAFPDLEVPAEIKEIGTEASATTRTFPVTLIMDQPEGYVILPGMAGRATGDVSTDPTGLTIPLSAVFTEEGGSQEALQGQVGTSLSPAERPTFVWIVDESEMTVKRRDVVPDGITARGMRLKEGLNTGEWIVTAGVYSLLEGQKIRISEQRSE
jgi:RND family efflux transporter MFP subunit